MKQRFLDTLKMIGGCLAIIAFFAVLSTSCEDREARAEREIAENELREQIRDEAYEEGYRAGFEDAADYYYEDAYADGQAYYKDNLEELVFEVGPRRVVEVLWDCYDDEIIEHINEYSGYEYHQIEND